MWYLLFVVDLYHQRCLDMLFYSIVTIRTCYCAHSRILRLSNLGSRVICFPIVSWWIITVGSIGRIVVNPRYGRWLSWIAVRVIWTRSRRAIGLRCCSRGSRWLISWWMGTLTAEVSSRKTLIRRLVGGATGWRGWGPMPQNLVTIPQWSDYRRWC